MSQQQISHVAPSFARGRIASFFSGAGRAIAGRLARDAKLELAAACAYAIGVVVRYRYIAVAHHPRHHATSDAGELLSLAERLLSAPEAQVIGDTVWPPGTSAFLATLKAFDPTLELATLVHVLLSALLPLLVANTTRLVAGARAATWALILASCHFGFIHYGGFFLSEQFFQFAVALALWLSVATLRLTEAAVCSDKPWARRALRLCLLGAVPGLAWGLAASIRPNALPVAWTVGALLAFHALRRRERTRAFLLAGGLAALLLVIAPLAHRCTVLSDGAFCPVSNNLAMNVALGQAGEFGGLEFHSSQHPELSTTWFPPALLHHGYTRTERVPAAIYETRDLLVWVWQRLCDDPKASLVRAVGNVLDLFRLEYWPDNFGSFSGRLVTVQKQAFLLLVVVPGLMAWIRLSRRALGKRTNSALPLLLWGVLLVMAAVAACSLGEPRYRIPFDCIFITLTAAMFAKSRVGARVNLEHGLERRTSRGVWVALTALVTMVLVVITMSHPALGLGHGISSSVRSPWLRRAPTEVSAQSHARVRVAGSAWDQAENHVFTCRPHCSELRLAFPSPQNAESVELSVDDNDRYLVTFYRDTAVVARVEIPIGRANGLRVEKLKVPGAASGFDKLGVLPLYGDGNYALGHLAVR